MTQTDGQKDTSRELTERDALVLLAATQFTSQFLHGGKVAREDVMWAFEAGEQVAMKFFPTVEDAKAALDADSATNPIRRATALGKSLAPLTADQLERSEKLFGPLFDKLDALDKAFKSGDTQGMIDIMKAAKPARFAGQPEDWMGKTGSWKDTAD